MYMAGFTVHDLKHTIKFWKYLWENKTKTGFQFQFRQLRSEQIKDLAQLNATHPAYCFAVC